MLGIMALVVVAAATGMGQGVLSQDLSSYHCALNRTGFFQPQETDVEGGAPIWRYQDCAQGTVCFPDYGPELSPCRGIGNDTCSAEYANVGICAGLDYVNSVLYCDTTSGRWTVESCPWSAPAACGIPTTESYGTAECEQGPVYGYILATLTDAQTEVEETLGYLSFEQGFNTSFRILSSFDRALRVAANYSSERFSILGINTKANKVNLWVGGVATGPQEAYNLSVETDAFVIVTGTAQTALGARPRYGGNSYTALTGEPRAIESAIWSVSVETMELSAYWVNSDGTVVQTEIAVNQHHPYTYFPRIFLTGNYGLFAAAMGGESRRIKLYFVPEGASVGAVSGRRGRART